MLTSKVILVRNKYLSIYNPWPKIFSNLINECESGVVICDYTVKFDNHICGKSRERDSNRIADERTKCDMLGSILHIFVVIRQRNCACRRNCQL